MTLWHDGDLCVQSDGLFLQLSLASDMPWLGTLVESIITRHEHMDGLQAASYDPEGIVNGSIDLLHLWVSILQTAWGAVFSCREHQGLRRSTGRLSKNLTHQINLQGTCWPLGNLGQFPNLQRAVSLSSSYRAGADPFPG